MTAVTLLVVRGRSAPQRITVSAPSVEEARATCIAQGYTVLDEQAPQQESISRIRGALPYDLLAEQLRDLIAAGLSVPEALDILAASSTGSRRAVLTSVLEALETGLSLSAALESLPGTPPLLTSLLRASEQTSDVRSALDKYLDHAGRVKEIRHRVASIATYPTALVLIGACVVVFLLFFVVPRFARVFDGMRGELPWSASLMMAWSKWLTNHGGALLLTTLLVVALLFLLATPRVRMRFTGALLNHPVLARNVKPYLLARWYRTSGMLVNGGVALPEAIAQAAPVLPNALRASALQVQQLMVSGLPPTEAYARSNMLTSVARHLMAAGERTGDFGATLSRIAQFHETEAVRVLERWMRLLEPVVMVLLGLGVGVIVVLMYMPIFELASAIQ